MTRTINVDDLALSVAKQIAQASNEGKSTIRVASLAGRKVRDLNPDRLGDFDSKLWSAGGHYVGWSIQGRLLRGIQYKLEINHKKYTGVVAVSNGRSAQDFDL